MRTKRPAASASDSCQRCTAVLLGTATRCTLCGWPVGAAYPPVDGEPMPSLDEQADDLDGATADPGDDAAASQEAQDAQLDALAQMAARRLPATVEADDVEPELAPAVEAVEQPVAAEAHDAEDDAVAQPAEAVAVAAGAGAALARAGHDQVGGGDGPVATDTLPSPVGTTTDAPVPPTSDAGAASGTGAHAGTPADGGSAPSAVDATQPAAVEPVDLWSPSDVPVDEPAHHASASPKSSLLTSLLPRTSGPVSTVGRRAGLAVLSVPVLSLLSLVFAFLTVVLLGNSLDTLVNGGDPSATLGTAGVVALLTVLMGIVGFLVWVLAVVLFLMWVSTARHRVTTLSVVPQRWSPTWSVAGWLIPFFNIYLGWQVLEDLWRGSDPALRRPGTPASDGTAPAPVLGWMVATVSMVLVYGVNRLVLGSSLIGSVLGVVAVAASAYFLCRVITQVSQWQDDAQA